MAAFTEMGASLIVTLNGLHFCVINSPIVINRNEWDWMVARWYRNSRVLSYSTFEHAHVAGTGAKQVPHLTMWSVPRKNIIAV